MEDNLDDLRGVNPSAEVVAVQGVQGLGEEEESDEEEAAASAAAAAAATRPTGFFSPADACC